MKVRTAFFCVILVLGISLHVGAATQQGRAKTNVPPPIDWVTPLLGKSQAEAEKTLGKPAESEGDASLLEATYKRDGFKSIGVSYYEGKLEVIEIEFIKSPADWRAALAILNIPRNGVSASKTREATFQLAGVKGIPVKWEVLFIGETTSDDGESTTTIPAKISFYGPNSA